MADPLPPDAQAAYEKYLSAAQALPAERILPYRLDPDLALVNIKSICQRLPLRTSNPSPKQRLLQSLLPWKP
jgi:hypothetical protein